MAQKGWLSVRIDNIEGMKRIPKGKKATVVREILEQFFRRPCPVCKGTGFVDVKVDEKKEKDK